MLCLYKSAGLPFMENHCHVLIGSPNCWWDILSRLTRRVCYIVDLMLTPFHLRLYNVLVFSPRCYRDNYFNNFILRTARFRIPFTLVLFSIDLWAFLFNSLQLKSLSLCLNFGKIASKKTDPINLTTSNDYCIYILKAKALMGLKSNFEDIAWIWPLCLKTLVNMWHIYIFDGSSMLSL